MNKKRTFKGFYQTSSSSTHKLIIKCVHTVSSRGNFNLCWLLRREQAALLPIKHTQWLKTLFGVRESRQQLTMGLNPAPWLKMSTVFIRTAPFIIFEPLCCHSCYTPVWAQWWRLYLSIKTVRIQTERKRWSYLVTYHNIDILLINRAASNVFLNHKVSLVPGTQVELLRLGWSCYFLRGVPESETFKDYTEEWPEL